MHVRPHGPRPGFLERLEPALGADPRRLALVGAAALAIMWLAGAAHAVELASLPLLELDTEGTIPTAFTGALLAWAGVAALVAARRGAAGALWLRITAGVLVFMAFDELLRLHEFLEAAIDFDWQILYLPVLALAALGWTGVLGTLGADREALLGWVAAATCWIAAQALELFQWAGSLRPGVIDGRELSEAQVEQKLDEPAYLATMLPEELLEMGGALLFALVLLGVARRSIVARSPPANDEFESRRRS